MLGYRAHVFDRYLSAINASLDLRRALSAWTVVSHSGDEIAVEIEQLKLLAQSVRSAVSALRDSLPEELADRTRRGDLDRHLSWLDYWLAEKKPQSCQGDAIDLTERDIPSIWRLFEEWLKNNSKSDDEFVRKVGRLHHIGESDSALRKAWVVFKTRMVAAYNLDSKLDGRELIDAVFGQGGPLASVLPRNELDAYASLFRALYALNRNEAFHNDIPADPLETEGLLLLLSSILARLNGGAFVDNRSGQSDSSGV